MTTPLRCPKCGSAEYGLLGMDDADVDRYYCRSCCGISYTGDCPHLRESHRRLLEACEYDRDYYTMSPEAFEEKYHGRVLPIRQVVDDAIAFARGETT